MMGLGKGNSLLKMPILGIFLVSMLDFRGVPFRERIHIPPKGEVRKIIDSKKTFEKGICDRSLEGYLMSPLSLMTITSSPVGGENS